MGDAVGLAQWSTSKVDNKPVFFAGGVELKDKGLSNNAVGQILKVCTKCLHILPLSAYYKNKRTKSGIRTECKECMADRDNIHHQTDKYKNRIKEHQQLSNLKLTLNETKVCTSCKGKLPLTEFNKAKKNKDGFFSKCKTCRSKEQFSYRQTDHYKQLNKIYITSPKGKEALKRGADKFRKSVKYKEWWARYNKSEKRKIIQERYHKSGKLNIVWIKHDHKRRDASKQLPMTLTTNEWEEIKKQYKYRCVYCGERKPLTRDHIIPLTKGGGYIKENILPACASCNARKGDKPVLLQLLAMANQKYPILSNPLLQ